MNLTIKFKRSGGETDDPLVDYIRASARKEGWTGVIGFQMWARLNYNAQLRHGKYGDWTSIRFKNEQDMVKFLMGFR